jgi:hypothetical protein
VHLKKKKKNLPNSVSSSSSSNGYVIGSSDPLKNWKRWDITLTTSSIAGLFAGSLSQQLKIKND